MRTTLAQAKSLNSGIAQAIGINACDARFTALLNRAQLRLASMGRWWGTYVRMYVCATKNCMVWPRGVASVEGVSLQGKGIRLRNEWFEFGEAVRAPQTCQCVGVNTLYDRPNVCHANQFTWTQVKIRIYPTVAADAGAKILLQGVDTNSVPIRTSVSGTYVDGEQLTLASPFVTSTFTYTGTGLTGVQKPVTKGRLNVYCVNVDDGTEAFLGFWEASEQNPSYRRTYLPGAANDTCDCHTSTACNTNGCDPAPTCNGELMEAIVRLEPVDVSADQDWLLIANLEALKCGMKAMEKEDRNQYENAEIEWGKAKRILNNELNTYDPPQKIMINPRPQGSAGLDRIFGAFR